MYICILYTKIAKICIILIYVMYNKIYLYNKGLIMTKIARIDIHNLKNVYNGTVNFKEKENFLNIVGIYGQNGSGKTTLIDAVSIYQGLVQSSTLPDSIDDYISDEDATISIFFEKNETAFEYKYTLSANESGEIFVSAESIISYKLPNYTYKKILFEYKKDKDGIAYSGNVPSNSFNLSIFASFRDRKSFVFGTLFDEWIENKKDLKKYQSLYEAYSVIRSSAFNINIHTEQMNGLLAVGNVLPLSFVLSNDKGTLRSAGVLPLPLANYDNNWKKTTPFYPKEIVELIQNVFEKISSVINKIVPGVNLVTKVYPRTTTDGSKEEYQIEVLTKRENKEIPLRAESLGIQKLVSILALLIEAYNNPDQIVFIDELDSGIFEFLLGELVRIFSEGAKGQLIFTSHNLRVLEELPDNKIYFSTNDKKQRYTKIKGVRESNNLRNLYLREIRLDEHGHHLYDKTNATAIKMAFEDADIDESHKEKLQEYDFGL